MKNPKDHTIPQIEVISPIDVCSCSFSIWMNQVWDILNNYKGKFYINSLTSDSQRAKELGVTGRTVVVNGEIIPVFLLKDKLNELID